ncbi:MAG TPA: acylphosphatase [Burkholderiales bacterium]|nr:acylphosphatase [Burkholderiales bacterium]
METASVHALGLLASMLDQLRARRLRLQTRKMVKHLRIHGRVQGVFFRETMRRQAEMLGITGWVRNCFDMSVEAMLQGTPEALDTIIAWAHHGPESAQVERLEIKESEGNFTGFEILRTR